MTLSDRDQMLVAAARAIRQAAYAPYSNFPVGAAVLTRAGKVFTGVNVENAVNGLSICAERNAIFQAVTQGEREIVAVAVVTGPGVTPCGACRQVMQEFAGPDLRIFVADMAGHVRTYTLEQLLPDAFSAQYLPTSTR